MEGEKKKSNQRKHVRQEQSITRNSMEISRCYKRQGGFGLYKCAKLVLPDSQESFPYFIVISDVHPAILARVEDILYSLPYVS